MSFKIVCTKCNKESPLHLVEQHIQGKRYRKKIVSNEDIVIEEVNDGISIYCSCGNEITEDYGYTKPK